MKTDPAYNARLQARIERVPEDQAWNHRGSHVLLALMLASERRILREMVEEHHRELPTRLMGDALLMAQTGMLQ